MQGGRVLVPPASQLQAVGGRPGHRGGCPGPAACSAMPSLWREDGQITIWLRRLAQTRAVQLKTSTI